MHNVGRRGGEIAVWRRGGVTLRCNAPQKCKRNTLRAEKRLDNTDTSLVYLSKSAFHLVILCFGLERALIALMKGFYSWKFNVFRQCGLQSAMKVMHEPEILLLCVVYVPKIGIQATKLLTPGGGGVLIPPLTPMCMYVELSCVPFNWPVQHRRKFRW